MRILQKAVKEDAFAFFKIFSRQSVTSVFFLAISNCLHHHFREKTAELCTETIQKERCMTLVTLKSILLPIIFITGQRLCALQVFLHDVTENTASRSGDTNLVFFCL